MLEGHTLSRPGYYRCRVGRSLQFELIEGRASTRPTENRAVRDTFLGHELFPREESVQSAQKSPLPVRPPCAEAPFLELARE
jgi:hypothetical protein